MSAETASKAQPYRRRARRRLSRLTKAVSASLPDAAATPAYRARQLAKRGFFGSVRAQRQFIAASEKWSSDQLEHWQWERLTAVLAHAYTTVPFYRAQGLDHRELRGWEDFRRLPLLEKSDLQERGEELLSEAVDVHRREYTTTGGSTGEPVGAWHDVDRYQAVEMAFMLDQWSRVGYRVGDPTAIVRGTPLPDGRLWEKDLPRAELRLSSFDLEEEQMAQMLDRARRFRPRFLQAYPSSAFLLAQYMIDASEPRIDSLSGLLCGSENLYGWQRKLIYEAFGVRPYSWYGQTEQVCLAGECEFDTSLHIFPQYSFAELVDAADRVITEPGLTGTIVGTTFFCDAMPLIRYRTDDRAAYADGPCKLCGRPYRRLAAIDGRLQEFMVSHSGRPVSMTAINLSALSDTVRQYRFVQEIPGAVRLLVVAKPGYRADRDEARIRHELAPLLRPDIELTRIELVDSIAPTASGKHRFLDQHLAVSFSD